MIEILLLSLALRITNPTPILQPEVMFSLMIDDRLSAWEAQAMIAPDYEVQAWDEEMAARGWEVVE